MITWLQTSLQKHYKWLFSILLAIIIVAFVLTIGAPPTLKAPSGSNIPRPFYGLNLNSDKDMGDLSMAVSISSQLNRREFRTEQDMEQAMLNRAIKLYMANRVGFPEPDEDQLTAYIQSRPLFQSPTGGFNADIYRQFLDGVDASPQINRSQFRKILADDFRLARYDEILKGPGYATPEEALLQIVQNNTRWTVDTALLDYAGFEPEIVVEDEALLAFFNTHEEDYRIPTQWVVDYLTFPADHFKADVAAPSESQLEAFYKANPRLYRDAEGETSPLSDVREKVLADYTAHVARRLAAEAASDFAYALFTEKVERNSEAFKNKLAQAGLELRPIPHFSRQMPPLDSPVPPRLLFENAFQLNPVRYYSDALATEDGALLLVFNETIPSRIPDIKEVRAEVIYDYSATQKQQAFAAEGDRIRAALKAAVAQGEDFADAAEKLGLSVVTYEDFTIMNPPRTLGNAALREMIGMNTGHNVSPMISGNGEGIFLYVRGKVAPDTTDDKSEITEALAYLAELNAESSLRSLLFELRNKGLEASTRQ